jgi:hypothetical protein
VALPSTAVKVSANRSSPGEGPPDTYSFFDGEVGAPVYTCNSPEVIVQFLCGYSAPPPAPVQADFIQIGFPGRTDAEVTYVGSWQWDVHGEARGAATVLRAGAAIVKAIDGRKEGIANA